MARYMTPPTANTTSLATSSPFQWTEKRRHKNVRHRPSFHTRRAATVPKAFPGTLAGITIQLAIAQPFRIAM